MASNLEWSELPPGFSERFVWGKLCVDLFPLAVLIVVFAITHRPYAAPTLLFLAIAAPLSLTMAHRESCSLKSLARETTCQEAIRQIRSDFRRMVVAMPVGISIIGLLALVFSSDPQWLLVALTVGALETVGRGLKWLLFDRWLQTTVL
jgi:hypothetical protein